MKTIRVHTAFDFTNPDYSQTHYAVGVYPVDDFVAEHWFTQQFAEVVGGSNEEQAQIDALFQTEITTLQSQLTDVQGKVTELEKALAEREKVIAGHVQTIADRDSAITTLQSQLTDVQGQLAAALAEGAKGGKK